MQMYSQIEPFWSSCQSSFHHVMQHFHFSMSRFALSDILFRNFVLIENPEGRRFENKEREQQYYNEHEPGIRCCIA
jgi:hypothetical protein